MDKVNLFDKFASFQDHWSPKIAAELNDHAVKLVKVQGEFVWHHHAEEDEMFFVVKGRLTIRFRDRDVVLEPNELLVVPRGVEHMPVAEEEAWILLVEPTGTLNTGNVASDRTVADLEKI